MEDNYSKAYKEVMEILKFVPKESVDKIPQTMIDTFKAKMDIEYDFKVDINKSFEEQDLLEETKAIFANIFRDFWATPYQKERIEAKEKYDRQKLEEEKAQKYNPDDLFKKKKYLLLIPFILCFIHIKISNENLLFKTIYLAAFLCIIASLTNKTLIKQTLLTIILIILVSYSITTFKIQNFASLNYIESFNKLHESLKENYVLNKHKNINYDNLYQKYIIEFKNINNEIKYYQLLENYLNEFNDAHIGIKSLTNNTKLEEAKESFYNRYYDFNIFFLDNKTYVATGVSHESMAYKKGLREGNIITKWNGKDINNEIQSLKYLNVSIPNISNKNVLNYYLPIYLSATGNEENEITFINDKGKKQVINLKSIDNGYKYIKENIKIFTKTNEEENFTYKVFNNTSYLKITNEKDDIKYVKRTMDKIVDNINKDESKNLILDLRNNEGGSDVVGSVISSFFSTQDYLYIKESILKDNKLKKINEIYANGYKKINIPTIILVNGNTKSAGEILAYNLQNEENILVAGLTSTNGSISTVKKKIIMPHNLIISIPTIAIGKKDDIIIDSNNERNGGLKLNIKIPINSKTINDIFNENYEYEVEYLLNYLKNI